MVDTFDMGEQFADRYTVIVLPVEEYDRTKWVMVINSGERPNHPQGVFIVDQKPVHEVSGFRFRNGRKRIAWKDLPAIVRENIVAWESETV